MLFRSDAYKCAAIMIEHSTDFIEETANILKKNKQIKIGELNELINDKYVHLLDLQLEFNINN